MDNIKTKKGLSAPQIVIFGFLAVIMIGAFLLMLPISSEMGSITPFIDALFTSVTSVCVTGLVVFDTATYWSSFGQAVILVLVQIGGLGVISVAAFFSLAIGRKIGVFQRSAMQEAVAAPTLGGIVKLTSFLLKATFIIELVGAVILAPVFIGDFGIKKGIWMSVFHSVSAFCNAGLDLMGVREKYSSLTSYAQNPVVNITVMMLVVIGGLGFLTWDDIKSHGIKFKKYRMQSKVILVSTFLLIFIPAVFFFIFEFTDMALGKRVLASLFQSVTTRTAGFNTANLSTMSEASQSLMIFLMLIGGSPGSTAGGMKTTTFAVLVICALAIFRRRNNAQMFGRRVAQNVVYTAITISFIYIALALVGAIAISIIENVPMLTALYETASAVATVGLSLGITPKLCLASKCILMALMYIGRVGGLTLVYAMVHSENPQAGKLPLDKIIVG